MKAAERLIHALSDGEFHSGEQLGALLGVSRTAVWKQLEHLQEYGLSIERVRGLGYRLESAIEPLSETALRSALPAPLAQSLKIQLLGETGSTNADALAQLPSDQPGYGLWAAEYQQGGRGRRGRRWEGSWGANLQFSVSAHFSQGAGALEGLSLAVGVAVCQALESLGVEGVELKWPNDLLLEGRKLAGILVELAGDLAGECDVVVGIGLNVQQLAQPGLVITQPWISLREAGYTLSRNTLLAAILMRLLPLLRDYERGGFAPWRQLWLERAAFRGEEVTVFLGERAIVGRFDGVDASGALRVATVSGVEIFNGGEVSVRPRE